MTETSRRHAPPRRHRLAALQAVALVAAGVGVGPVAAQTSAPPALPVQVERRFDVLTLQDGLALRPKSPVRDVRWVEVSGGTIRVNGAPVSGVELRDKLGDDADVVLQLSYLDPAARAAMFRDAASGPAVERPTPDQTSGSENRTSNGGRFTMGGSITVPAGEIVSGDVVNVGGTIHVFGEVRGDVVAIGTVELGPAAHVTGDVTVIGGYAPARSGRAHRRGSCRRGFGLAGVLARALSARAMARAVGWLEVRFAFSLLSTLTRVAVLCLLAALVILLGRDHVGRISARAAAEPLKAGVIGLLAQLLLAPTPTRHNRPAGRDHHRYSAAGLDPLRPAGAGRRSPGRFHRRGVSHRPSAERAVRVGGWRCLHATTIAGILIVVSPLLLARLLGLAGGVVFPMTLGLLVIGTVLEYIAWTIGFGAVALARFHRPGPAALLPGARIAPGSLPGERERGAGDRRRADTADEIEIPVEGRGGRTHNRSGASNWPAHEGSVGTPPGTTVIV